MTHLTLSLPEPLERLAREQAAAAGISLDEYVAAALAERVNSPGDTARYFGARAARAQPGRAREILARIGVDTPAPAIDQI